MPGLSQIPLRIPDQWDPTWMRMLITEVLAKADVRNAIGVGLTITSSGNSVATISSDAETVGAISTHNDDPLAHVAAFDAHRAESNPHPQFRASQSQAFFMGE